MKKAEGKGPTDQPLSATELAEMGLCEKRVQLRHRLGVRQLKEQEARTAHGLREHRRYFEEGAAATRSAGFGGRCLIVSRIFGDTAWQTNALRRSRDGVLLTKSWGRQVVRACVWTALIACAAVRRWPMLQKPVRVCLDRLAPALRNREDPDGGPL